MRKCAEGAVGGAEAAVPFLGVYPFDGCNALLVLWAAGRHDAVGMELEPCCLLEVPAAVEVEDVICFDCFIV